MYTLPLFIILMIFIVAGVCCKVYSLLDKQPKE